MTDIMKDLSNTSFFVPIIDAQSPIAYSVINEIHWDHAVANHSGVETVYRYVLQVCYIINGRNLVKLYRKNCERCRYLAKRTIDIAMGPVSSQNLTIAPAFFITQLDLVGKLLSSQQAHHSESLVCSVLLLNYFNNKLESHGRLQCSWIHSIVHSLLV